MKEHMKDPIIGLTALRSPDQTSHHHILTGPYVRAVTGAGGYPIVVPAIIDRCDQALDMMEGAILRPSIWGPRITPKPSSSIRCGTILSWP